jgi:hypothetical protein
MISEYGECLIRHYETVWANSARRRHWERGPIHQLPQDFCVVEFQPSPTRNMWTYGTCCMSQIGDSSQVELHMFAPYASDLHVELLTIIAHYHRTGHMVGLGDSVNFGRPWLSGSSCSFGLISLPYLDGPEIEDLIVPELGINIKCYWLIPLTAEEVEYKKTAGVEALEQSLEESSFNYLDPKRRSVAGMKRA